MLTIDKNIETSLKEYLNETKPLLVEFYNPDKECCRAMEHVMTDLRKRLADKANILQINGTENEDLMAQYKIDTYPSYIIFKDGAEVWRDSGRKPVQELEHMMREFV